MADRHTVLLITSDDIGWYEVRACLASLPDVRIIGDTADRDRARHLALQHRPSVIVAAADPGDGLIAPLLAELRRDGRPDTKGILLARAYAPGHAPGCEEAGVVGLLLWGDLSRTALHHALAVLMAGEVLLGSRAVVATMLATERAQAGLAGAMLTARERAILNQLARGRTREEIAGAEGLSLRTVKRAIANLEQRFEAPNLFLLGMVAARLGVTGDEQRDPRARH